VRTIGRTAALQRVSQQFDPILSPEYLAVEYAAWRAEYVGHFNQGCRIGDRSALTDPPRRRQMRAASRDALDRRGLKKSSVGAMGIKTHDLLVMD
jgi:hypothetical protein